MTQGQGHASLNAVIYSDCARTIRASASAFCACCGLGCLFSSRLPAKRRHGIGTAHAFPVPSSVAHPRGRVVSALEAAHDPFRQLRQHVHLDPATSRLGTYRDRICAVTTAAPSRHAARPALAQWMRPLQVPSSTCVPWPQS